LDGLENENSQLRSELKAMQEGRMLNQVATNGHDYNGIFV
jgi:hypothetical protein